MLCYQIELFPSPSCKNGPHAHSTAKKKRNKRRTATTVYDSIFLCSCFGHGEMPLVCSFVSQDFPPKVPVTLLGKCLQFVPWKYKFSKRKADSVCQPKLAFWSITADVWQSNLPRWESRNSPFFHNWARGQGLRTLRQSFTHFAKFVEKQTAVIQSGFWKARLVFETAVPFCFEGLSYWCRQENPNCSPHLREPLVMIMKSHRCLCVKSSASFTHTTVRREATASWLHVPAPCSLRQFLSVVHIWSLTVEHSEQQHSAQETETEKTICSVASCKLFGLQRNLHLDKFWRWA